MRGHRPVLAVVCLALMSVVSAVAAVNVALPDIARETGASQTQLSWIVDAYALTFAALLLPGGALGDRFGRRRMLLAGLSVFAVASLGATMTSEPSTLIAFRALLGVGAALVMPATLSTITATFPPAERVRGVAVWSGVAGAGAVLGLLLSGALLEWFSWRSVFWINVVLATVALVGTARVVPESSAPDEASRDVVGAVLSVAGLGVLVYALIEAPTHGWLSAHTLGGLAVGVVVLAAFIAWEARTARPLIDPRHFLRAPFAAGSLSLTAQFFCFFGFIFAFLQYLQLVRGDSPLVAALSLLPLPLGLMPAARTAPKIAPRLGQARLCGFGLVLAAVGLTVLSTADTSTSYWVLAVGLWPLGLGMGWAMTPATAAITDALPASQQGVASAVNDLARELGGALGIAVIGSVLNATYRAGIDNAGLPGPIAEKARESVAVATHIGGPVQAQAHAAFVDGMQLALLIAAGTLVAAAVSVVLLLSRSRRTTVSSVRAVPSA
ncbi:MFS transporter [Luteipulveratus halotolerans]|nr:MFS transporter [Luteipulveratus halotolerans]